MNINVTLKQKSPPIDVGLNNVKVITDVHATLQEKTVEPSTDPVIVLPDEEYQGLSKVTVNAIKSKLVEIFNKTVTEITAEDLAGATHIPAQIFINCTLLENAVVPDTVLLIGTSAFQGCSNLKNITIGDGVETIQNQMLYSTSRVKNISIGKNIKTIGAYALWNLYLDTLTIKAPTAPIIQATTFSNDTRIATLTIQKGTKELYQSATNWAAVLERVGEILEVDFDN